MRIKGIRGRWMLTGLAVILGIAALAVSAFSLAVSSYYYTSIQIGLETKAQMASDFFTTYVSSTRAQYNQSVYNYTASFEDKDKLELQFVNLRGRVEASSYGLTHGSVPNTPDIQDALETGRMRSWSGKSSETGERLMVVSSPLTAPDGQIIGVMRYVTSLQLVDKQVTRSILLAATVGVAIVIIVFFSNVIFIRSIVEPITVLTSVTRGIAEGSYGAHAEKKHDDEIGELIDAINEMSTKISRAEKMQTEFISSVSHELRTPLTAITGWSETLLFDEEIGEDSRRGIGIISKEASRLTKMVEELLEFTRIQDGRFNLTIEEIDVAAELEESIYTYRELLQQENIELVYRLHDDDMPFIPGDAERLRQVFLNVLDNAAKYGREGGKIEVDIGLEGEYVVISTRDHGAGIPEAELPYVKKMFYKGSSKERGSGIGLSVSDEIITRHNGSLDVENAPGGGLIVTVKLPATTAAGIEKSN